MILYGQQKKLIKPTEVLLQAIEEKFKSGELQRIEKAELSPIEHMINTLVDEFEKKSIVKKKTYIKLKEVTLFRKLLREGGYDNIAIWEDGTWDLVSSNLDYRNNDFKPIRTVPRYARMGNVSHKRIAEIISNIEEELNGKGMFYG